MKSEIDNIRDEIVARRDQAKRLVDRETRCMDYAVSELLAHDRAVAAMSAVCAGGATPAAEPKPERHAVQRVVMAMFGQDGRGGWIEPEIIAQTGLPEETVHGFLLRAVRQGTLRRDGDVYSLPRSEPAPASVPGPTDLAAE